MKCKMFRNYLRGFVSSLEFSRERSCDKRLLRVYQKTPHSVFREHKHRSLYKRVLEKLCAKVVANSQTSTV